MPKRSLLKTFAADHPELSELHLFTKSGKSALYGAIKANEGDRGTARFGVRLMRAISVYEGTKRPRLQPIYRCLLYGPPGAPLAEIAHSVAEHWIGTPPTETLPITHIDCSEFPPSPFARQALRSLIGPQREDSPPPRLFNNVHPVPDMLCRVGRHVLPLRRLMEGFPARLKDRRQYIQEELGQFLGRIAQADNEIIESNSPYRSVILFDGIEFGSPELVSGIIRPIVQMGFLEKEMDFRNSLIILTMYDPIDALRHGEIGFSVETETASSSHARYTTVRRKLLKEREYSGLLHDIGDQLVMIGPRNRQSEERKRDRILENLIRRLQALPVHIAFTHSFRTFLLNESKDPDIDGSGSNEPLFPANRLEDQIDRYVYLPLSQIRRQRGLLRNHVYVFDEPPMHGATPVITIEPPQNAEAEVDAVSQAELELALQPRTQEIPETKLSTAFREEVDALVRLAEERERVAKATEYLQQLARAQKRARTQPPSTDPAQTENPSVDTPDEPASDEQNNETAS